MAEHKRLYDGDQFEHQGRRFSVRFERDDFMGAPWEEHDGHGIVSDWTNRPKAPGERVLVEDRDSRRYYDVQATMARALAEGWGVADPPKGATKRQIAALAVARDFEYLRAWCADEWEWLQVEVTREDTGETESTSGIDGDHDGGRYLTAVAYELAGELVARGRERAVGTEGARMVAPWADAL